MQIEPVYKVDPSFNLEARLAVLQKLPPTQYSTNLDESINNSINFSMKNANKSEYFVSKKLKQVKDKSDTWDESIYKMLGKFQIEEYGTNFPKEIYDPKKIGDESVLDDRKTLKPTVPGCYGYVEEAFTWILEELSYLCLQSQYTIRYWKNHRVVYEMYQLTARLSRENAKRYRAQSFTDEPVLNRSETKEIVTSVNTMRETQRFHKTLKYRYRCDSDPLNYVYLFNEPIINIVKQGEHSIAVEPKSTVITPTAKSMEMRVKNNFIPFQLDNIDRSLAKDILDRRCKTYERSQTARYSTQRTTEPTQTLKSKQLKIQINKFQLYEKKKEEKSVVPVQTLTIDNYINYIDQGIPIRNKRNKNLQKYKLQRIQFYKSSERSMDEQFIKFMNQIQSIDSESEIHSILAIKQIKSKYSSLTEIFIQSRMVSITQLEVLSNGCPRLVVLSLVNCFLSDTKIISLSAQDNLIQLRNFKTKLNLVQLSISKPANTKKYLRFRTIMFNQIPSLLYLDGIQKYEMQIESAYNLRNKNTRHI